MNPISKLFSGTRNGKALHREPPPDPRMKVLNVTRQTFLATRMEVADNGPKRNKGLLGRDSLAPGEGLWIVPCEAVHTFAMRFPIDLVYLDRKHRIKKLRHAVPPWRLSGCLTAHSIIELPQAPSPARKPNAETRWNSRKYLKGLTGLRAALAENNAACNHLPHSTQSDPAPSDTAQ